MIILTGTRCKIRKYYSIAKEKSGVKKSLRKPTRLSALFTSWYHLGLRGSLSPSHNDMYSIYLKCVHESCISLSINVRGASVTGIPI